MSFLKNGKKLLIKWTLYIKFLTMKIAKSSKILEWWKHFKNQTQVLKMN